MQKVLNGQSWVKMTNHGWFTKKEVYKWVGQEIRSALLDIPNFGEQVGAHEFWSPEPDYDRIRELLKDDADLLFCGDVICVQLTELKNKNFILKVWVSAIDEYPNQED